jgi:mannose/fructose/N-acetylgalactosamine-specific phosphotransferase system component IID
MKPDWQAIFDAVGKSLAMDPALVGWFVLLLLIMAVVVPLYLAIKLRSYRAGLNRNSTMSPDNLMDLINRLPADGETIQTRTGLFGSLGSAIKIAKTVTVEEPTVMRMDGDAVQKAQLLLATGKDMDSICREINPEYASWGSFRQQMFQKAMEAVLKAQR